MPKPEPGVDDARVHEHVRPYVREELDARSLHFSICEIQSRMQILHPDALALEYTRTMMGWLMFKPAPERVAMIGLGGGSLVKFCHRHVPRAALVVVEINPHVIALRDAFEVPPDDARLQVIEADGARYVAQTDHRFDVLMVDAFDDQGMPAEIGAQRFYDDCLDVLRPGGVMAVNLHAGHRHFPVYLARIRRSFGDSVLRVDDGDGCNSVIFASKGGPLQRARSGPVRRPATLAPAAWAQLRGAFTRVANAMVRAGE
ncbi:MAG: fused MFS/spermidine synthase [Burkholderiales bacterium]|nr:fused MFS/spermidine synthase [Burkholderiales bacterium]